MTETKKISAELSEEKETYGLYDQVKVDLYLEWCQANNDLRDIEDKDLPMGNKEISYMRYGSRFVSRIMSIYRRLKHKIPYMSEKSGELAFKRLYELDEYELKGKNTADMTFLQAKEYFDIQTAMLERLGITRFEFEKLEPAERILREAFSSD